MISAVFSVLSAALNIFMLLCVIRVALTWVPGASYGRFAQMLCRIVDPFLNWFKRFPFLRFQNIDFSPVAGFMLLSLGSSIFATISRAGYITVGKILALVLSGVWSIISFMLGFYLLLLIIQLVLILLNKNLDSPMWMAFSSLTRPFLYRVQRTIAKNKIMNQRNTLLLAIVTLVLANMLGGLLARLAISFLSKLPF